MAMKVLMAIDGSEQSFSACQWYLNDIRGKKNEVILAYVTQNLQGKLAFRPGLGVTQEQWEAKQQEIEDKNQQIIKKFSEQLSINKVPFTIRQESGDQPGVVLCRLAKEEKVDLILMGTRGLGTVKRTVLGSVSDHVMHNSNVPVAIFRNSDL